MGAEFNNPKNPLLLSVRSGARVSMPGMMDTVLNLGLNDETVAGIIEKSGNERFGWDSYRRFIQMYGDVVMGLKPESKEEHDPFEGPQGIFKARCDGCFPVTRFYCMQLTKMFKIPLTKRLPKIELPPTMLIPNEETPKEVEMKKTESNPIGKKQKELRKREQQLE